MSTELKDNEKLAFIIGCYMPPYVENEMGTEEFLRCVKDTAKNIGVKFDEEFLENIMEFDKTVQDIIVEGA